MNIVELNQNEVVSISGGSVTDWIKRHPVWTTIGIVGVVAAVCAAYGYKKDFQGWGTAFDKLVHIHQPKVVANVEAAADAAPAAAAAAPAPAAAASGSKK